MCVTEGHIPMTLAQTDRLLSPKEMVEYLKTRYGIIISLASLYSMISRGDAPKVTYFRNRPKFTISDIEEWVLNNRSYDRK
jgi:predicted DNA-binding transcriptional regulator AlpA